MKIKNISALFIIIAGPIALLAACSNSNGSSSATDRKIEDAAKSSYNFKTVLADSVTVKADAGNVTLTGTVGDNDEKNLAADTVENLPGVISVDNQITVVPTYPEHSDGWVAFKIHYQLLVHANVSVVNTKVVVNDGNVILSGPADNVAQKELTEAYVKDVDGVKSVDDQLVVKDQPPGETAGETMDDASITSQVKYALFTHQSTSALKTKVTTTDGVVQVSGEADSDAEKSLVTKLASDIRGVKSVTNDMTVKS
jgi:osmotically-inducible protein OsmY